MGILSVPASSGQGTVKLPTRAAAPLRLSATSRTTEACGNAITTSAVQQDLETQLRSAGITVSEIHNAQIATDLDCVALGSGSRRTAVAIRQCLVFSEVVSAASREGKPIMASTWQNCQSYTCRGAKCESQVGSATGALIGAFLSDYRSRAEAETQSATVIAYTAPPKRNVQQFIYYTVFLMACLSLFYYWQRRRHAY